jgi:hypothetical protein
MRSIAARHLTPMFDLPVDNSTRIPLTGRRFCRSGRSERRPNEEGIETLYCLHERHPAQGPNDALMKKGLKPLMNAIFLIANYRPNDALMKKGLKRLANCSLLRSLNVRTTP